MALEVSPDDDTITELLRYDLAPFYYILASILETELFIDLLITYMTHLLL